MQSLRSRRSQAPPRKAQRAQTKLAKPGEGRQARPPAVRKGTRVDDRIKKRMSMRYADISSPTELTGIPAMPSIPVGLDAGTGSRANRLREDEAVRDRSLTKGEVRVVQDDKKILDKEDFDPDAFLKLKMSSSTEAEIKSLQSSLSSAKDDTAADLQRNVFKNYAELVVISKEISTLENEMLDLKESLSEYKSMPALLHIPDPTTAAGGANSNALSSFRRSSVADLRIMYYNQMQTLHAQIEGSAKFAPITPGRHVIGEIDGVLALNAATYKVAGKVKFVVLDDAVLVAKRRRRTATTGGDRRGGSVGEGKLVAERCWPLNEMLVLDTKDSPTMANVFKIKHGKETHVFRTETPSDKKSLLVQFRQVADELAAKKRKEREGEHERRKSMWQSSSGSGSAAGGAGGADAWLKELAEKAGVVGGGSSDARTKGEKDTRYVSEWSDELNVAIALREWEKAVSLVEEGKSKSVVIPSLAPKLPPLQSQLTSALLQSLSLPSNRKTHIVQLSSWLLRLQAGAAARSTFLSMRTGVLKGLVRKIRFEGHAGAYIGDLAVVYFTGIKHTADWFLASFKENEVASSFIEWARKEVVNYCEMFRKQVYTSDVEKKVVEECMRITYTQSRKLLQDYGLDFRFLFDDLLLEHPRKEAELKKTSPILSSAAFRSQAAKAAFTSYDSASANSNDSLSTNEVRSSARAPSVPSTPTTRRARSPAPPQTPLLPEVPPVSTMPLASSRKSTASTISNSTTSTAPPLSARDPPLRPPSAAASRAQASDQPPPPSAYSASSNYSSTPTGSILQSQQSGPPPPSPAPSRAGARTPISAPAHNYRDSANAQHQIARELSDPPPVPLIAPLPRRTKTPEPNGNAGMGSMIQRPGTASSVRSGMSSSARMRDRERDGDSSSVISGISGMSASGTMGPRERGLRATSTSGSPAPPPRNAARPGSTSGHRPPPVAVPQREGMF